MKQDIDLRKADFIAKVHYKPTKEGGRSGPAFSRYRPHISFHHLPYSLTSAQQVFLDREQVFPGESALAAINLIHHKGFVGNLNVGDTFNFGEGSRVFGTGEITKIIEPTLSAEEQF